MFTFNHIDQSAHYSFCDGISGPVTWALCVGVGVYCRLFDDVTDMFWLSMLDSEALWQSWDSDIGGANLICSSHIVMLLLILLLCRGRSPSDSGNPSPVFWYRSGSAVVQRSEERPAGLWRPHVDDAAAESVASRSNTNYKVSQTNKTSFKMVLLNLLCEIWKINQSSSTSVTDM